MKHICPHCAGVIEIARPARKNKEHPPVRVIIPGGDVDYWMYKPSSDYKKAMALRDKLNAYFSAARKRGDLKATYDWLPEYLSRATAHRKAWDNFKRRVKNTC